MKLPRELGPIHFVGIGGSGMSGIARMFAGRGISVTGSDRSESATTRALRDAGIVVHIGHDAANLGDAEAVVVTGALWEDNPEYQRALASGIPVAHRSVALNWLLTGHQVFAVAGAHGKTTTTAMVVTALRESGADPSFVNGGVVSGYGVSAAAGSTSEFVIEADESDASFLNLLPVMAVVTNIDADHMDTYGHDFNKLKGAFIEFLHRMPFYGAAILCTDDAAVRSILSEVSRPITSYGFNEEAQVRAINVRADNGRMSFTVQRRNGVTLPDLDITLNLAGEHNVLNALAAIAVAVELNVPDAALQKALAEFKGVGRRFQRHGEVPAKSGGHFTLIEDYGHHPVEVAATLAAARGAFPGRRLVLAFQPHRYTRTRDCFEDFVQVMGRADVLWLAEVYAAGEAPIVAADGRALSRAMRVSGHDALVFVEDIQKMAQVIADNAQDGDVVMCMGAGSIGQVPTQVLALMQQAKS